MSVPLFRLTWLAACLVTEMTVDADRMRSNLDLTHGALLSQRAPAYGQP